MSPKPLRHLIRAILAESQDDANPPYELPYTYPGEAGDLPPPPGGPPVSRETQPDDLQRRGANLLSWFGDSKIRNADGSPLRMYHGASSGFTTFKAGKTGMFGPGIYFTDEPAFANRYAGLVRGPPRGERSDEPMPTPNVMPVYLRVVRPYVINPQPDTIEEDLENSGAMWRAKKLGYDGIIAREPGQPFHQVVVWDPRQIKSAVGNAGDFDWRQEDITLEEGDG